MAQSPNFHRIMRNATTAHKSAIRLERNIRRHAPGFWVSTRTGPDLGQAMLVRTEGGDIQVGAFGSYRRVR